MSKSSYHVKIPKDLGARLRVLDRLSQLPQSLGEYGDLLQEYNEKCLKEPRFKAHFQEIIEGKRIFGHVDYKTRHKIKLPSRREVYVACAFDALVEGFFQSIEIDSVCVHCSQRIQIRMDKRTIDSAKPSSTVLWLGASKEGKGPSLTNLCPYINFFCSTEHVAEWKEKNPGELGMMLTLQQTLELANKGYWTAMRQLKTET